VSPCLLPSSARAVPCQISASTSSSKGSVAPGYMPPVFHPAPCPVCDAARRRIEFARPSLRSPSAQYPRDDGWERTSGATLPICLISDANRAFIPRSRAAHQIRPPLAPQPLSLNIHEITGGNVPLVRLYPSAPIPRLTAPLPPRCRAAHQIPPAARSRRPWPDIHGITGGNVLMVRLYPSAPFPRLTAPLSPRCRAAHQIPPAARSAAPRLNIHEIKGGNVPLVRLYPSAPFPRLTAPLSSRFTAAHQIAHGRRRPFPLRHAATGPNLRQAHFILPHFSTSLYPYRLTFIHLRFFTVTTYLNTSRKKKTHQVS
jgi:hypothetical protein